MYMMYTQTKRLHYNNLYKFHNYHLREKRHQISHLTLHCSDVIVALDTLDLYYLQYQLI